MTRKLDSTLTTDLGCVVVTGGDETLPYTTRFADLYTETKAVAEEFVLSEKRFHPRR